MTSTPSFYEVLGLTNDSSPEEIKRRYRKLSLEYHPDRPNGDRSKFELITEAYEILGDEDKRLQYDKSMHISLFNLDEQLNDFHQEMISRLLDPMNGGMFGNGNPQVKIFRAGVPGGMMGAGSGMFMHARKPAPIDIKLEISLDQAYTGCSTPIQVERWAYHDDTKVHETETCYIDVPAGADDDEVIVVEGKGHKDANELSGDVRVSISITNTTKLIRRGLDLTYPHSVSLKEALCGFTFDLEYLQGQVYKINNGSGSIVTPQYRKRLPKMGFKRGVNQGDLIIEFNVQFPTHLSDDQIKTLSETL